jgi:hypothetical protein
MWLRTVSTLRLSSFAIWSVVLDVLHLTEDPDHVSAALERDGAQLGREPLPVLGEQDAAIVGSFRRPQQVAGEDLAAPATLFRCEDRRHLAAPDVADDAFGGRVDPADDPVPVDDVGGNPDALERALDVGTQVCEARHAESLPQAGNGPGSGPGRPRYRPIE